MATPTSTSKRKAFEDGNDGPSSASKRPRTSNPPSYLPPQGGLADLAAPAVTPQMPVDALKAAEAARKREEVKAKFAAMQALKNSTAKPSNQAAERPSVPKGNVDPELMRRVSEATKKVQELATKRKIAEANPYLASSVGQRSAKPSEAQGPKSSVLLHPLLAGPSASQTTTLSKKDRYKPMQPKFATTKANARTAPTPPVKKTVEMPNAAGPTLEEAKKNPYFDRRLGVETLMPKSRKARPLKFNAKGKFVRIAEERRREARMEEMKQRVLEMARKSGMDAELENMASRIKRQAPPEIEWWDAAFVTNNSYDDLDASIEDALTATGDDAAITRYVQHPIPIQAPQEKNAVAFRGLMLTKKEQKKLRRTRRQTELQDKQDRIRMGLLPADPPKVKISNMMRVLTQEAVADPTKVEARVQKEMRLRQRGHEKANAERKLTKEQRHEKIEAKKAEEDKQGIWAAAFRILNLSNGAHKFKVKKNAEQLNLTGCTIFHPKMVMVFVEGGRKSIDKYIKLMTKRISWTEEADLRANAIAAGESDEEINRPGPLAPEEPDPYGRVAMADNRCDVVWSGQQRERYFVGFRPKSCPTDTMAREWLGPKAEGFFDLAKNFQDATM